MSEFKKVYNKVLENMRADSKIIKTVQSDLAKIVQDAFSKAANTDESFCFKFTLPDKIVSTFFKTLKITEEELDRAVTKDWSLPAEKEQARMYHESYYQMMQLLIYIGVMTNNKKLEEQALEILLFRLWNGRKGQNKKAILI